MKDKINLNGLSKPVNGEKRIYVINHASLLDGLLMFYLPGDLKFMANESYSKIPVFGLGITLTDNISVKKGGEGKQLDIFLHGEEIINKGYPLVVFPEGTRSKNGMIGRFAGGTFLLALNTGADIVPVVFETWNTLRPGSFIVRDNVFNIEVLDTVKFDEIKNLSYKEISSKIRKIMINRLLSIRDKKRENNIQYYRNQTKYRNFDDKQRHEII